MPVSPAGWLRRLIPDRSNRALLGLTAGVGYPLVWVGPFASAGIYRTLYDIPVVRTLGWLMAMNTIAMTVALAGGAFALSRMRRTLTGWRALAFAIGVGLGGAVFRLLLVRGSISLNASPLPEVSTAFFLVQLSLGLIFIAALSSAILYASGRESTLDTAFAELNRAQLSLAQEEEQVRGEVFDHLHGTLQAEFVAMRQELTDLAATTSDPQAAQVASDVEQKLARAYREGVQELTRALFPPGLEAGLQIALIELQERLTGAMTLTVAVHPIVAAMDDPISGGIHRDARMAAYRIVEEAAANAMEHSNARQVDVDVSSLLDDSSVCLDLRIAHRVDTPVVVTEGSGLARMRTRARALGGSVDYGTVDHRFTVRAVLPLLRPDGGRWSQR